MCRRTNPGPEIDVVDLKVMLAIIQSDDPVFSLIHRNFISEDLDEIKVIQVIRSFKLEFKLIRNVSFNSIDIDRSEFVLMTLRRGAAWFELDAFPLCFAYEKCLEGGAFQRTP